MRFAHNDSARAEDGTATSTPAGSTSAGSTSTGSTETGPASAPVSGLASGGAPPETVDLRTATSPQAHGSRFRPDVEGLRAVAVGLVVAFHAGVALIPGGYVGVDVFFVLSGFLITGLLLDELRRSGTVSLRTFWARRVRRLLPMSALVLIVTAVASYRILPPLDAGGVAADIKAAALYFANWHYAAESTEYMADTDKSPVLHFWSLAVEEQFYVVWPLLLLLLVGRSDLARRAWPRAVRRVAVAVGLVAAGSFAASVLTSASGSFAYFGLHTRAWELAAGAGLALARPLLPRIPRAAAYAASWVGLAMVVGAALTFDDLTVFPGAAAAVPVLGTVLLVAGGASGPTRGAGRLLSVRPMRYVGRVSYAWYLWHWPALVLVPVFLASGSAAVDAPSAAATPSAVALAVALSFLLAVASHHLVEQPVRVSRWLSAGWGRSVTLGAALTAVSVTVAAGALVPLLSGVTTEPATTDRTLASATPVETAPAPGETAAVPAVRNVVLSGPDADSTRKTPEEAREDNTTDRTSGCYVGYDETAASESCVFGDPEGDEVVALVGDSHADQWFPAADRLARERGWQLHLWAKSGCPMHDAVVMLPTDKSRYDACTTWRGNVIDRLEELPRLDAVLVGRVYLYPRWLLESDGSLTPAGQFTDAWQGATERMLDELRPLADRVVLLAGTPQPGEDVPACLSEAPGDLRRCDFPRDEALAADKQLLAAERAAAADADDVATVSLVDDICPVDPCPAVTRDGTIMYRDIQHLSAGFSERLWEVLGRRIDPVLNG